MALKLFILVCAFAHIYNAAAWINMSDRLKDLVVHFNSIRKDHGKNWLVRSAYKDKDWSYYTRFDEYSDTQVLGTEKTKWLTKDCGEGYLCFESVEYKNGGMPYRNRFLRASYPKKSNWKLVMLKEEYSPEKDEDYHYQHKVECETEEMTKCRISSRRSGFENDFWCMQYIDNLAPPPPHEKKGPDGYYVHYCSQEDLRYWRILAPSPNDQFVQIYNGTNEGHIKTSSYKKTIEIGMTSTTAVSNTVTQSTTIEVSASFSKFGAGAEAGVTQTVGSSWSQSSSQVWSVKIEIEYQFRIEPRSRLTVYQMKGTYGSAYDVFSETYYYQVDYLDDRSQSYKSDLKDVDLDLRSIELNLSPDHPANKNRKLKQQKSEL